MLARMKPLDLNLLVTLDVLIQEGSVVGAARRLNLNTPAMSRSLARIREAVGDRCWCAPDAAGAHAARAGPARTSAQRG